MRCADVAGAFRLCEKASPGPPSSLSMKRRSLHEVASATSRAVVHQSRLKVAGWNEGAVRSVVSSEAGVIHRGSTIRLNRISGADD